MTFKKRDCLYWRVNVRFCGANKGYLILGLFILIPFLHGITYLDAVYSADCLEKYVSLTGAILFPALAAPEQEGIRELLVIRPITYRRTLGLRMGLAAVMVYGTVLIYGIVLKAGHCAFPYWLYTGGAFCTAAALGSLGLLASVLCKNQIAGYLASLGYYLLNQIAGQEKMGIFFLNGLTAGESSQKIALLLVSMGCLMLCLAAIRD